MKKILFATMITQLLVTFAVAQTKDISGTVTNEKNEGITGASVKVKTNTQSTFTDDNGTFSLAGVPDTAVLVISAKGYQEQEVSVVDKSTVTVILVKSAADAGKMLLAFRPVPKRDFIK